MTPQYLPVSRHSTVRLASGHRATPSPLSPPRVPSLVAVAVALAFAIACDDLTPPGSAGVANLALHPSFDVRSVGLIGIGGVHVTFTREDGSIAYDTTVAASDTEGGTTIELTATVVLRQSPELLRFDFEAFDLQEQMVYQDRDDPAITVTAGETAQIPFELQYTGPGWDAQLVRIRSENVVVRPDGSVRLEADALNARGTVIAGAYFGWEALDTGISVPNVHEGVVEGNATAGQARVTAFLPTVVTASSPPEGHADTVLVMVRPNQLPTVTIADPIDGAVYGEGHAVIFEGSAMDEEDGPLTGLSMVWRSDRDGELDTGETTFRTDLTVGRHTVSLSATDSEGGIASSAVTFDVVSNPVAAFESSQQSVSEADAEHAITVELSATAAVDISLPFSVAGTATRGDDFTIGTSPLLILAGEHTASIPLTISQDTDIEPDETIVIVLGSPEHADLGSPGTHTVVIADDDLAPIPDAGADQTVHDADGDGAESVTLDATRSSDPDGTIVAYQWTEGAAVLASGPTPLVDLGVGTHTVTVTVIDDADISASDDVVITVLANAAPIADAGPDQRGNDADLSGSEPVVLDASGSSDADGAIASYTWTANATQLGTGVSISSDFSVGVHSVTLTVVDNGGATATDEVIVTVTQGNQPPVANAGTDSEITDEDRDGEEQLVLNGLGSTDGDGTIVSYVWTEGAAHLGTGGSLPVVFAVGAHTVTLTVTDDGGASATDQLIVTVHPGNTPPSADAGPEQIVQDDDGSGAEQVTLNGSQSSDEDGTIVDYEWAEGASVLASGPNAAATVSVSVGVHVVTLTVTDENGATDSDDVTLTVEGNVAPTADAGSAQQVTDTDLSGAESVTLNASGSSDVDGTISSYQWSDGATPLGSGVSIAPTLAVGVHTVTLTVTDNGGATDTDQVVITVDAGSQPVIVLSTSAVALEAQREGTTVSTGVTITNGGDGSLAGLRATVISYSPDSCNDGVVNACWLAAELSNGTAPTTVTLFASPTGSHPETGPWTMTPGIRNAVVEISSTTPGVATRLIDVAFAVVGPPGPPELSGIDFDVFQIEDPRCNLFGPDRLGTSFDVSFTYNDPDGDVPSGVGAIGGSWVFFPSGARGGISTISRQIIGDRFVGSAQTRQCYAFGTDQYVDITMTLTDSAGNQATIPIRITKPAGSN